jgi:hypothetical protein
MSLLNWLRESLFLGESTGIWADSTLGSESLATTTGSDHCALSEIP